MSRRLTIEEFIQKAKVVHGDKYDYSKVDYINNRIKIKIICLEHGEFKQIPINHLKGKGCLKCGYKNQWKIRKITTYNFIDKAKLIHENKYDYSDVNYIKSNIKVKIKCKEHGIFEQTPNNHLRGKGCPKCYFSSGEMIIEKYLKKHNIDYILQKRFIDCKNKKPLPFDFYLSRYNICIEYDGEQHFKPIKYWGGTKTLKRIKMLDNIKTKYCLTNNILLIRINYTEYYNILNILNKYILKV
jgi:hypothetical protein